MTIIHTQDQAQAQAVVDLVRWFDVEASSLHHALVMAAERNETDAKDPEVQQYPPVVGTLTESAARWRAIAARVLELEQPLGDVAEMDNLNDF